MDSAPGAFSLQGARQGLVHSWANGWGWESGVVGRVEGVGAVEVRLARMTRVVSSFAWVRGRGWWWSIVAVAGSSARGRVVVRVVVVVVRCRHALGGGGRRRSDEEVAGEEVVGGGEVIL